MGFELPEKTFTIRFGEGHDYHGLEVETRSVPIETVLTVMRSAGAQLRGGRPVNVDDVESVEALFVRFGEALVSWNLTRKGEPVPATPEGLRSLDFDVVTVLAMEWIGAMMGAAAPLGSASSGGATRLAALPMEPNTPGSRAS